MVRPLLSDLPSVADRAALSAMLEAEHDDVDDARRIAAAFWGHVDALSLWATCCDATLANDPGAYFQRKAVMVAAMDADMQLFVATVVPAAAVSTDDDARLLGRLAELARWMRHFCGDVMRALECNERIESFAGASAIESLTFTSTSTAPRPLSRQDVRERFRALANVAAGALLRPDNYAFEPNLGRNTMRLEVLTAALQSKAIVDAEVARLEGIFQLYFPALPSEDPTSLELFFDPPLSSFQLLQRVHEWACALGTQDLHNRMLAAQEAILADLKGKFASLRRSLVTLKQSTPDQRAAVFASLDQLHYDAVEFQRAVDRDSAHPALRLPAAPGSSGVSCCTATAPPPSPPQPPRSWWSLLTCSAEVTGGREVVVTSPSTGSMAAARAKAAHNRAVLKILLNELQGVKAAMDAQYPAEYSSGVKARAGRAVDAMLAWAQQVTVVFEPERAAVAPRAIGP